MPIQLNALMNPAQIAQGAQTSFQQGQKTAREMYRDRALETLSQNPDDPRAQQILMKADPEMAMKFRNYQHKETEFQDEQQFKGALKEYYGGGGDTQASAEQGGLDLSSLGEPQTPKDGAFMKMLQIDPVKAMKIKTTMRDNFVNQMKADRDTLDWAVTRFAGITDPAAYTEARTDLARRLGPAGASTLAQLPEEFPGVEGLNQLRLRAMEAKDQITFFQRQANIDADNERADRNTNSLISDRSARRSETARNNNMRDKTTQRGQDIRGSGGRRENLPVVNSPAEALKLPSGTRFKTPDGRVKVRP